MGKRFIGVLLAVALAGPAGANPVGELGGRAFGSWGELVSWAMSLLGFDDAAGDVRTGSGGPVSIQEKEGGLPDPYGRPPGSVVQSEPDPEE